MIGRVLNYAVLILLGVVLLALVAGQLLGQPLLLTYVETESMEPTLNAGDGFVAVPAAVAGDVESGDVVMFESEHIHGGQLTTHRVIDEHANGYITQGDANLVSDQSRGEPPVTDGQIKAVALEVNGQVVRIPHLGTAAMTIGAGLDRVERTIAGQFGTQRLGHDQFAMLLFGLGIVAFAVSLITGSNSRRDRSTASRSRSRDGVVGTKLILSVCVFLVVGAAMAAMLAPAGTETYGIVSTEGNSSNPTIIPSGESDQLEYLLHNGGYVPTVSYVEPSSTGVDIEPRRVELGANETANATVTLHAPEETGYYQRSLTEHRYLVLLPPSAIDALYRAHPWLPYLGVNAVIVSVVVGLWYLLGGTSGPVRLRARSRKSGPLGLW